MHFSKVRYAYFTSAYDVAKNQFVQRGCIRDIKLRMLMKGNGDQGLQTIKVAPLTSIFRNDDRQTAELLLKTEHLSGDAPRRILISRYVMFLLAVALDRMESNRPKRCRSTTPIKMTIPGSIDS
jgi:hypothetical protein